MRVRKIISIVFASMLLLALVFTPARSAEKPHLLYATLPLTSLSQLAAFNLEANTVRVAGGVVGKIGYPLSAALAFCPPGGVAYTVTNIFSAPTSPQLATLNLGTGAATLIGPLPVGQDIMGMECSRDGTLYAIGGTQNLDDLNFGPANKDIYNSLYIINRGTGALTRVGSTLVNDGTGDDMFMALRFAPAGTLYGATPSALFTIDLNTGLATKVVDFVGVSSVMGLAIDSDGNFYVADFVSRSRVYALNTSTGVATPILDTGLAFVHSLAFRTPAGD